MYICTDIAWTLNLFIYNNRDVAEWLRRCTYKLVSLPYDGSNPTMNKIFLCVKFTCSVFRAADWLRSNEINHDIRPR